MEAYVNIAVGLVFIVVYAGNRFNTPPSNRASTTAARFYTAMFSYCAVGVVFYFLLINYPALLRFVGQGAGKDLPPSLMGSQSAPLVAALLLTVLLPKLPLVSTVDMKVLNQLHAMAAIPRQERDLAAELSLAVFAIKDEHLRERVTKDLLNRLEAEDIVFEKTPGPATPQYLWTKISTLVRQLEGWDGHRGPVRFLATQAAEWQDLRRRYDALGAKAQTCFELIREQLASSATARGSKAVREYRKDFEEQAEELLRTVYRFVSRGVLRTHLTHRARIAELQELGFDPQIKPPLLSLDQLTWLFLVLTTVFVIGLAAMGPGDARWTRGDVARLFLRASMIASIYNVCIWSAVYPKSRWTFVRRRPGALRPIAGYFVSAGLALVGGLVVSLAFKSAMFYPNTRAAVENLVATSPWLLMSFGTAFAVAWLTDNTRGTWSATVLRATETVSLATITAGIGVGVWLLLSVTSADHPRNIPDVRLIVVLSAIVGGAIGYCAPTWYRAAQARAAA